jgi:CheY-like chemotaxis protein/CheY-specific phosphatase CheX
VVAAFSSIEEKRRIRMETMNFENYIKSMAENCCQVYEEMTRQATLGIKTEDIVPPFSSTRYKIAIVIPYENKKAGIEGRFVLGFNDESMAIKLAADIAENTGMPTVDQLDGMATDILFEFMNTVAGKVVTEWDKMGLAADFLPPEFISNLHFGENRDKQLTVYSISIYLKQSGKLTILACLEETENRPLKSKKVLVVDDSKMIRYLLTNEFKRQGCQVSEAENGLEGLIKTQSTQPDLIIMDLIMPKMGGLEAIAKIREINSTVPIIVLTSTSKKEEVLSAAHHKVKGYIKKPLKMDQLLMLAQSCFQ